MSKPQTISLTVQDASGQREFVARDVPKDACWSEAMNAILAKMSLPRNDSGENRWTGRLDREGRHLHGSEIVGQSLREGDRIVLQPETTAG